MYILLKDHGVLRYKMYFSFSKKACEILNWNDKMMTGMILSSLNLAFFIHWLSDINIFTLAAYLLLFYIIAGIVISQIMKKEELQSYYNIYILEETIMNIYRKIKLKD